MRRWARYAHGLDLPHYAVSIVRGRGIDRLALRHLAAHHDPRRVVFVDGWTGKGAITRELAAALAEHERDTGVRFDPDLAVLADPGRCAHHVRHPRRLPHPLRLPQLDRLRAGVPHRAQRRLLGPGDFHGAKFYRELAPVDVSNDFLDAVTAEFAGRHGHRADRPTATADFAGLGRGATGSATSTASATSTSSSPASARPPGCCCAACPGGSWCAPARPPPTSRTSGCSRSAGACRSRRSRPPVHLRRADPPPVHARRHRRRRARGGRARDAVVCQDLDRTPIYSAAALDLRGPDHEAPRLLCVEVLQGRAAVVPHRGGGRHAAGAAGRRHRRAHHHPHPRAVARVHLPGPPARYAIASNGGHLLVDGVADPDWHAAVRDRLDGLRAARRGAGAPAGARRPVRAARCGRRAGSSPTSSWTARRCPTAGWTSSPPGAPRAAGRCPCRAARSTPCRGR